MPFQASWGTTGRGKTADMVFELVNYHVKHPQNPIYTNLKINYIPTIPFTDIEILFDIDHEAGVFIDEFWIDLDSMSRGDVVKSLSLLSIRGRKKGWHPHFTLQMPKQIQKRLRFITPYWREPFFNKETGIIDVRVWNNKGQRLHDADFYFDAAYIFQFYDTYADPLTFNIKQFREMYRKHKKEW